jgi:O-antigen/teichoic acid export membrane protein
MRRLWARATSANPLPRGAATVGAWLVFTGLVTYGFLTIAGRALGADRYGALSALWVLAFLVGPGFFLPLEQEVARALAARRALGIGGRAVVARAALLGSGLAFVLVVLVGVAGPALLDHVFDEQVLLLVALGLVLVGYAFEHLARGVLAGEDRFGSYGLLLGTEGLVRLVGCIVLAAAGVATAGPYGLLVGIAPYLASSLALAREHDLLAPGPIAPWRELTAHLGYLLAGSVLAQALVNAGPIVVQVLSPDDDSDATGRFFAGLLISRIPLFLFQAVQASLLPELSNLRGGGRLDEFRTGLRKLLLVVAVIGTASTVLAALLGPFAVRILFGDEFRLSHRDMALLAAGSAVYMVALALAQALIALARHDRAALGWACGVTAFVIGVAAGSELLLRVEVGYLAGSCVAAVAMAIALVRTMSRASEPAP